MEKIKIPNTDLLVSRICTGCMGLGGGWEKDTVLTAEHEKQASDLIDASLEQEINFFDTANLYARGRAEEVFGRVLAKRHGLREQIVMQSK